MPKDPAPKDDEIPGSHEAAAPPEPANLPSDTLENDYNPENAPANELTAQFANAFGAQASWQRPRGPILLPDGRRCIGRVGAPPGQEATSSKFAFWIPEDALVEATQIVTSRCRIPGDPNQRIMTYYALVEDVHRCSRRRGMGHEVDEWDGSLDDEPPYASEGITYATASILKTDPAFLTPPRERSPVLVASDEEAQNAYGANDITPEKRLPVGVIKNGGVQTAGPGFLDLDYLLGANGGHLNVSGAAGRATKSSFLLTVVRVLLHKAEQERLARPSALDRLRIVPILFNVKNFDLFYLDRPSRRYDPARHEAIWNEIGIEVPAPFENVTYYAPQRDGNSTLPIDTGRSESRSDGSPLVSAYSWSLGDVVSRGLLTYLFSDEDAGNDNFAALTLDLENYLTNEQDNKDGTVSRELKSDAPQTFTALAEWLRGGDAKALGHGDHHEATRKKLSRRLLKLMYESAGVLRRDDRNGFPLDAARSDSAGPQVIDLNGLAGRSSLQKFVVAAVLRQLVEARTGTNAQPNLKYIVALDELNRFAPKSGRDPVTKLFETIAAEMRSQGILLFGAQQQASLVSARVIENAAIKALGQTGRLELGAGVWSGLSEAAKSRAEALLPDEKLILQPGFRQPMHIRVPFPSWAMNPEEAATAGGTGSDQSTTSDLDDLGDI